MSTRFIHRSASICFLLQFILIGALAQYIEGPTSVSAGVNTNYSLFDDVIYSSPNWTVSGGYVVSQSHSGLNHYVTVNFQDPGTQYVYFNNGSSMVMSYEVTVSCATPATPSTTFSYASTCSDITITRNSAPVRSSAVWYWQTSPSGTSTSYGSESTFTVTSPGTYYLRAKMNNSNCWSNTSLEVPVVPNNPTPTNGSVCGSGQVTLSATLGTNGTTVRWYNTCTGGTLLSTGTNYTTPTLTSATTYYISSYNSSTGAEGNRVAITATVNPIPSGVSSANNNSRCGAGSVTLSGTPGTNSNTIRWYSASTGGTLLYTGTSYPTPILSATTAYYTSSYNSSTACESTSSRVPVTATINPIPSSPTRSNNSRCGTGTVTLTASPGSNGNTVRWYSASTGGTPIYTGTSYTTPSLSATTTYYISSYNSSTSCESTASRVLVTATINPIPSSPTRSNNSRCGTGTVTLTASPGSNGNTVRWYSASTGGTPLYTGTSYTTPSLSATTTYYISSYNSSTSCESTASRVLVTATINPIPSSPTRSDNSGCGTGTVTLTASPGSNGNTVRWYSASTGGTPLYTGTSYTTPSLSATTTYYISSYNSSTSCESTASRVPVTATINTIPSSPTGNNNSRCGTGTVTLAASPGSNGNTVRWYSVSTDGTSLYTGTSYTTPTLNSTTTYYISSYNSTTACESTASRVPVTATINSIPSSPNGNSSSRSGTGTVTLTASPGTDGTTVQWYSVSSGGVLLYTGTSYTTPSLSANATYYISSYNSTTSCESQSPRVPITAYIVHNNQPASLDKNFIRIENVLVGGVTQETDISGLPVSQKTTTYQYFDGLGRSFQSVTLKGSPSMGDFIQPFEYDQYGRQTKEYLPYTSSTETNGKFREDALLGSQSNYYTTPPSGVAATTVGAFKANTFELSPLNRVIEVVGPRDDYWNGTPKKVTTYTKLNVANEVLLWKDFVIGLPERNGFHAVNTLMVQETVNEEGKIAKIYTNLRGHVVMERVGDGTDWFDTHYIYSPSGLRMFVLQPEGVARLASEFENASSADKQSFLDRWAFQYQYDDELREITKRIPGFVEGPNGWFYTIYDKWNRAVLTQNPEQRTRNEYTFTKYDRFNRPIVTGLYFTATSHSTLRSNAAASSSRFETEVNNSTGYTLTATFPTSGISESDLLTITYYDNYPFLSYSGWDAQGNNFNFVNVSGYPQSSELLTTVKGHVTGSKVRMLGGDNRWLNSVTQYDKKYRPIQVITENHMGGILRTTSLFDFVGKVEKEQLYNSSSSLTIQNRYTYDHAGRQLAAYHQVNAQPEMLMVSNKYNELGQLIEKNIHSSDNGNTFLQSIDYRYNIKGWLMNVNNTSFTQNWANDDTNDLFGMELQYYVESPTSVGSTGDVVNQKSLYDGNISAIKWKTDSRQGTPEERIYVFDYDVLSRLKKAHYAKNTLGWSSPSWNGDSGMFDEIIHNYDKNGNIKVTDGNSNPQTALTRYGRVQNSKGVIDQLKYGYQLNGKHSNRLIDLDDTGNSVLGFKPAGASVTEEYLYDRNGNLKFDHNKSISSLAYNHLNLVKEVQFTRAGGQIDKIEYTYDATGNKLSQLVRVDGTQVWKTSYVGGIQYDNDALSFFTTKEGRMVNNNGTFDYEYFYKDHQGNVRLVYGPLKETLTYRATMENPGGNSTLAQEEETSFKNITETRHPNSTFNYTTSSQQVVLPDKSAQCNGYTGYSPVGPAKMLDVSAGDKVYIETYAKYNQITGANVVITAAALLSAFTSPFGIVNSGETATLYQSFNANLPGISEGMGSSATLPKAYLVWLFFDSNNAYVRSGGQAITTIAYNAFEKLSRSFTAEQNGSLYIYVTNESNASSAASVYFDETYIVHEKNNTTLQVLQASDYYPFGLSFNSYQADRLKETSSGNYAPELRNRYLFQGQELQKDLDLGWYQFKWRMHDPAIGRFGAVDPLAAKYPYWSTYVFSGNQVVAMIELEGLEPTSSLADAQSLLDQYRNQLSQSTHWSNVSPEAFISSLGSNIGDPSSINQGGGSWFCGNAACSKYVAQNDPVGYVNLMTELYKTGRGTYDAGGSTITFNPSESVRKDAGNLKFSGIAGNAANQMMFLTLSDHYKGYVNQGDRQYNPGDASGIWASTTLGEFKKMMGDFGYKVNTYGGDLGWANLNKGGLAGSELGSGNDVFLYVNSDLFKRGEWSKNWSATHYIQLNGIKSNNGAYQVNFWDYGNKTNLNITQNRFWWSTYGLISVTPPSK